VYHTILRIAAITGSILAKTPRTISPEAASATCPICSLWSETNATLLKGRTGKSRNPSPTKLRLEVHRGDEVRNYDLQLTGGISADSRSGNERVLRNSNRRGCNSTRANQRCSGNRCAVHLIGAERVARTTSRSDKCEKRRWE
jgi:hypothetical protein